MSQNGYILLWRTLTEEKDLWQPASTFQVYIHCLLKAQWKESEIKFNNKMRKLKRGELLTGIRSMAQELELSTRTVQDALKRLVESKRIAMTSDYGGTIITVKNYEKYQDPRHAPWQNVPQGVVETTVVNTTTECGNEHHGVYQPVPRNVVDTTTTIERKNKLRSEEKGETPDATHHDDPPQEELELVVEDEAPVVDPAVQNKKREDAVWKSALWEYSRLVYLELGLQNAVFPKIDGKMRGLMGTYIKRFGGDDVRSGIRMLMHAVNENADRYEQRRDEFWYPTLPSILSNQDKLTKLLGQAKTSDLPDPGFDPFKFYAEVKKDADEIASNGLG